LATLSDLVARTEDIIYGVAQVERPQEDTLTSTVASTSDTTWRFDTETMWKRGDYAQPIDAGELIIFAEDHPSGADVDVRRGQRSTDPATYSTGDVFVRNPSYPRHLIETMVDEVVGNDLWPHVWMWYEGDISYATGDSHYELPANIEDVIQMYQLDLGVTDRVDPLDNGWWRVMPQVNTAGSSTGKLLRLFHIYDPDSLVYYTGKQKPLASEISELSDEIVNMIPWKAAAKLLAGRSVQQRVAPARTPQRANQGDRLLRDYGFLDVEFRRMRQDEQNRLKKQVHDWQPRYVRRRRIRG
jgi:hypothetical protein